jgi:hypothetical protein
MVTTPEMKEEAIRILQEDKGSRPDEAILSNLSDGTLLAFSVPCADCGERHVVRRPPGTCSEDLVDALYAIVCPRHPDRSMPKPLHVVLMFSEGGCPGPRLPGVWIPPQRPPGSEPKKGGSIDLGTPSGRRALRWFVFLTLDRAGKQLAQEHDGVTLRGEIHPDHPWHACIRIWDPLGGYELPLYMILGPRGEVLSESRTFEAIVNGVRATIAKHRAMPAPDASMQ